MMFSQYEWGCMRTLASRLQFFNISYIDHDVEWEDVYEVVERETKGAGNRLVTAEKHKLLVPC